MLYNLCLVWILINVFELTLFLLLLSFFIEVASRTVNKQLALSEGLESCIVSSVTFVIALEGVRALIEIRSGWVRQLFQQSAISIVASSLCE